MRVYKRYLKSYLPLFMIAVLFLILEATADLFQPMLIARLIDDGIGSGDMGKVRLIGLMMLFIALGGLFSAIMRNILSTHVSYGFARRLRKDLYDKLLQMNMLQVEEIERGSMINRLTFDVRQLQLFFNGTMRIFLKAPFLMIGSFIMVMQLNIRFVIVYLAVLPIMVLAIIINIKLGYPKLAKIQVQLDRLNKKTIEYLNGIRVVKAFNRTAYENQNFSKVSTQLKEVTRSAMRFMAIFNPIIMMAVNLAIILVLINSKSWLLSGTVEVGQIVAFVNYMTQLMFASTIMSRVFNMFIRAKTSNQRVMEIFNLQVPSRQEQKMITREKIHSGICISNVSYHYGNGECALKDIDFKIEKGQSLGIIGMTGSGKTTLINLLIGLLKPTEGEIIIGDEKLLDENITSYRQHVGYVPQDKVIFSDTVSRNIAFDVSDQEGLSMDETLRLSVADFVYDMADQEDTLLGKGGVNISGGQQQRIALARAIKKAPSLLLLDDSTSALDAVTERRIFQNMHELQETTLIVVGQKISTVRQMDKILVLDDGKMTGFDTHERLLENCEAYQAIFEAQLGGEQR